MTEVPLDVRSRLGPERAAFLALLGDLTTEQWELSTECPAWTVKGLVLHVLGDDLSLLSRQRDLSTDSLTIFAEDHPGATFRELLDGFNEQWVIASQFFSTELIVEMLHVVGTWTESFYGDVDLSDFAREPVGFFAADGPSPYWHVVGREYVERVVHQSQIRRAIGAGDLDVELLHVAVAVQVHAIGAWMRHHVTVDGATIGFEAGATGMWRWVRSAGGWTALKGADGDPDALISLDPASAVAAMTRGISEAGLRSSISISVDATLTGPFVDLVVGFLAPPAG